MKLNLLLIGLLGIAGTSARATLYSFTSSPGVAITDNNPVGITSIQNVDLGVLPEGVFDSISSVIVDLNITGGYNGDLYGYLVHDGGFAVLLNRVGTGSGGPLQMTYGYNNTGFAATLEDGVGNNGIHLYQNNSPGYNGNGQLTGNWGSDGGSLHTTFDGMGANGTWTLALFDLSGGAISTLDTWTLHVDVVPEPTTWALIVFGATLGIRALYLWQRRRSVVQTTV